MEGAKKRAKKLFNEHTRNEEDNSGPRMVVVGAREKECSPLFDTSQNLRIGQVGHLFNFHNKNRGDYNIASIFLLHYKLEAQRDIFHYCRYAISTSLRAHRMVALPLRLSVSGPSLQPIRCAHVCYCGVSPPYHLQIGFGHSSFPISPLPPHPPPSPTTTRGSSPNTKGSCRELTS